MSTTKGRRGLVIGVVLMALGLMTLGVGCGGSGTDTTSDPAGSASSGSDGELERAEPLPELFGVPRLDGTVTVGGTRPVFAWSDATGAASYQLVVRDRDGNTVWAWSGETTSVALGGGVEPLTDDSPGPRLTNGGTWEVLALNAAEEIIAATDVVQVSP